ncbi:hypothetical protein D3C75_847280 [compost metagenome]
MTEKSIIVQQWFSSTESIIYTFSVSDIGKYLFTELKDAFTELKYIKEHGEVIGNE